MKKVMGLLGFLVLVSPSVWADAAPAAASDFGSPAMSQGILLAAFGVIFYFFFIRPQSKRAKEHQQLLSNLAKGDEVVTTGGLLGKITRITDNFFMIMIAEGVEVSVQKNAIALTVPKNTMKDALKANT